MKNTLSKFIRPAGLVLLGAGWLVAGFLVFNKPEPLPPRIVVKEPPKLEITAAAEKQQLDFVNQIRAERGLRALKHDERLDNSALAKAQDMISRDYYGHTTPDGLPFDWLMRRHAGGLSLYGENLAQCADNLDEAFQAWRESPGHLANILNPEFNLFGSHIEYSTSGQLQSCYIIVNHFGEL